MADEETKTAEPEATTAETVAPAAEAKPTKEKKNKKSGDAAPAEADPNVVKDERDQEEAQFADLANSQYHTLRFLQKAFPGYATGDHADPDLQAAKTYCAAIDPNNFSNFD